MASMCPSGQSVRAQVFGMPSSPSVESFGGNWRVTTKVVEVELAGGSGTQRQWNSEVLPSSTARTLPPAIPPGPGQPGRY
jgi:hypothetical protein